MVLGVSIIALILVQLTIDFRCVKSYIKRYKIYCRAILRRIIAFFKDWRNGVSFLIAWMITNGWGWCFMFLGRLLQIKWMKIAGDAYIAFLWLPVINEKVVTVTLAVFIKKVLFRRKMDSQKQSEFESQIS